MWFNIQCDAEFYPYNTPAKNERAKVAIVKWIMEGLKNEFNHVPLYIESDIDGSKIEDVAQIKFSRIM